MAAVSCAQAAGRVFRVSSPRPTMKKKKIGNPKRRSRLNGMKNGIERNTSTSRGIYVASKNTPESCTDGKKHCEKRVLRSVIAARVPRQNEPDTTVAAAIYATAAVVESVRARRSYHRVRRPGACDDGYGGGWETNARKEKVRLPVCVRVFMYVCECVVHDVCEYVHVSVCVYVLCFWRKHEAAFEDHCSADDLEPNGHRRSCRRNASRWFFS